MRLYGYYVLHSFINQARKLLKTWVLIFILACGLLGGLIGFGAGMLSEVADEQTESMLETGNGQEEGAAGITDGRDGNRENANEDDADGSDGTASDEFIFEVSGKDARFDLIELVVGGFILAVFLFEIFGADKAGSSIFLPADVNLLFASPLKPQSVLMFRLMTQIGMIVVSSIYVMTQLPSLAVDLGLGARGAAGIILVWIFTLAIGKLLQVLCYTVTATHTEMKKYLRRGIYALLIVLAAAYYAHSRAYAGDPFWAAATFFNQDGTRWIPLWGWVKGLCMFAVEGDLRGSLLCLFAVLAGTALLAVVIWKIKADFYEDAMAKSEETAELQEIAAAEKSTGFVKRKKDRSEKVRRDGMRHGSGANVFFFRSLYNRFRFAHFGIFTKTAETYLAVAAGVTVLCRYILETDGFLPVILTLSALVFWRTLGNPLEEDTSKDFFRMIPESTGAKLLWSVLGGTVNCLLDLLPALLLAEAVFRVNPLYLLAWIPFMLSVDFYGTATGTFIHLSVPVSAGKLVKQLAQVLFIYFGLLPDLAVMAVGIVFERVAPAAVAAAVINFGLGALFLALAPLFVDPKDRPARMEIGTSLSQEELHFAKKTFSTLGFGCFAILAVASALQVACAMLLPEWAETPWGLWVYTFVPMYVIAVPVGLLIFRRVPAQNPAAESESCSSQSLSAAQIVKSVFIAIFLMYAGNLAGTLITSLIGALTGTAQEAAVTAYAMNDSLLLKTLFLVILAPIIEEYIFRKQLIDRMSRYGGKLAVVTSALMFGFFHGNFSQFFYAFALGLLFGYLYLKTGKLRYSTGLHMGVNFLGGVVSSALLETIDLSVFDNVETLSPEALGAVLPQLILYGGYVLLLLISAVVGLVLFCRATRSVTYEPAELELPKGGKIRTVYGNAGMILFVLGCAALIILSII